MVVIGEGNVPLDRIVAVATGRARVALSNDEAFRSRLDRSMSHLRRMLKSGGLIYGVTTGFGGSCGTQLSADQARELGQNLLRFHGCGTGDPIGIEETRASMLCRLLNLAQGYSAVSWDLLEQIVAFLNKGITPVVPGQGSVGASGDLTPMSYIGAALAGQREVFFNGERMPASRALEIAGIQPLEFSEKECLSIINGTSVMTGIAALAFDRSLRILDAAICGSALAVHALAGHAHHFHPAIFRAKPFPGQERVAEKLRGLLESHKSPPPEASEPEMLQDPYSLRCSPHMLGVLADALDWIGPWVETEANGVSDNPIFDVETGELLTGGNFYGGHIAFAMDALKTALASVADMCDRQIALLVDTRFNRGLPACLVRIEGKKRKLHHGFKGIQVTASALTAEASKNAMPVAVFSRSTESHNQDKVSLGTIAARDAISMCELVSRVVAIELMASAQACEIRGGLDRRPRISGLVARVRNVVPATFEDRPMDKDIARMSSALFEGPQLSDNNRK
jgi:histidine ammonia-lyase